jgi:hypothetical protein
MRVIEENYFFEIILLIYEKFFNITYRLLGDFSPK